MNETLSCQSVEIDASDITLTQLIILTVFNFAVMMGNVLANALVIFILIKTKQLSNVACKLIFMLSISDFLIGILSQNIFFGVFYGTSCFIKIFFRIVTIFLTHWSGYIIAVLGID